jgi:hypothetical protein
MSKSLIVCLNGEMISVPAVEQQDAGQTILVPLVPYGWVEVTSLGSKHLSFAGTAVASQQDSSDIASLVDAIKAQTQALINQTIAISELVNSNLDLVDSLAAEDVQGAAGNGTLDDHDDCL